MKSQGKWYGVVVMALVMGTVLSSRSRAQPTLECFDSYLLLTGRCPDPCSHGNDCPCITCVARE